MRIGIDARFYAPRHSGPSRYTRELIKSLFRVDPPVGEAGKENQYVLFMTREDQKYFKEDFKRIPGNAKIVIFDYSHYTVAEQLKFIRVLNKERLDLVHFLHFNHPIFYRKPYVITIPDLTLSFYPGRRRGLPFKKWAYNWIMLSAIEHSKKIITISKNTKRELIEKMKAPAGKIKITYLGTDQKFSPVKGQKQLKKVLKKYKIRKPYLIYTGQWRTHKNLIRLVRGFHRALRKGLDAQLVIVGKKDPLFSELPQIVKEKKLSSHVILTDFVPDQDLPYLYKGSTAFVFPSLAEGFGLPPLEAMASGIPVISSDASCMPEVLGNAAFYFDPFDISDISRSIIRIIKDKKLQSKLRSRGIKQAKKYSWEKMARETLLIYNMK